MFLVTKLLFLQRWEECINFYETKLCILSLFFQAKKQTLMSCLVWLEDKIIIVDPCANNVGRENYRII